MAAPTSTSIAIQSQGSGIYVASTAQGAADTLVHDVRSLSAPGGTSPEIDVTHINSAAKEYFLGLPDFGTGTLEVMANDTDPGQVILRGMHASQEARQFKILQSNDDYWTISGRVSQYGIPSLGVDQVQTRSITIRFTGAPTFVNV